MQNTFPETTTNPLANMVPHEAPIGHKQHYEPENRNIALRPPTAESMDRSHFPQSQSDILSWLFTDQSPPILTPNNNGSEGNYGEGSPTILGLPPPPANMPVSRKELPMECDSAPSFNKLIPQYGNSLDNLTTNMSHAPELGMELMDLNFFEYRSNPLEDLFVRNAHDPEGLGSFKRPRSFWSGTASTSSALLTEDMSPSLHHDSTPTLDESITIDNYLRQHKQLNVPENRHIYVDRPLVDSLLSVLPGVSRQAVEPIFAARAEDISLEDRLSFYLYTYWEVFHPRFSIIHKPSFNTKDAEPLLILSMVPIGCMYSAHSESDSAMLKNCPEFKLCKLFCSPLRYIIFQHEDFSTPVRAWVVQSLNLLEWCEKNYLPRAMHERAHVHHGTTVQLLRRSPLLGGNPASVGGADNSASDVNTSAGEEESEMLENVDPNGPDDDLTLFEKWVESETWKRVTFMTFYLDIIDYVKFRHNPHISFFQLQLLNLPCDEDNLWNSFEINGSFKKTVKRQRALQRSYKMQPLKPGMNFLASLKRIMRQKWNVWKGNNCSKLPSFTKSILFGGLISIMHEMQRAELQCSISRLVASEKPVRNLKWKAVLTQVLDNWESVVHTMPTKLQIGSVHHVSQFRCKNPMYHLAQIIGMADVNHFDIAVYGGSPANMSVDATSRDMKIVQRKLQSMWLMSKHGILEKAEDIVNLKSVIHCYWFLWSLMLPPQNDDGYPTGNAFKQDWRVDQDFYDSMNAVCLSTLVLWTYCFSVHGAESSAYKHSASIMSPEDLRNYEKLQVLIIEDGRQYLHRIRQEFTEKLRMEGPVRDYLPSCGVQHSSAIPTHEVMKKYCQILPQIGNKQNIGGLCLLIGTKLLKSQWPIARENAKLVINCGLRSVGKTSVCCSDIFTNDFDD